MMTTIAPIRRQIIVPAAAARAFEVFTSEMTRWWPSAHHIGRAPIEEIVIEPREGGRWYTRHADGSETSTGYVAAWDPPHAVRLTWQISPPTTSSPAPASTCPPTRRGWPSSTRAATC
jgi:activator of Hsp90 ATPase-like protein